MKKNKRDGVMYSTNANYSFDDETDDVETLDAGDQKLYVSLDRKMRKGKTVTIVEDFIGSTDDLKALGKELKSKCGSGGSVKDGIIMVQGDFKAKIYDLLVKKGYGCKTKGG